MIQTPVSSEEFKRVLKSKERKVVFTGHGEKRASERTVPLSAFLQDLKEQEPLLVFEQESEVSGERKFNLYYLQRPGLFHRYVVSLNNQLRIITLMRTSKDIQKFVAGDKNEKPRV